MPPTSRFASVSAALLLAANAAFCDSKDSLSLPPEECVRMLRTARIAHMNSDTVTELETLRAAAEKFPQEVSPIYGLLQYHRDHGLSEEEEHELRALLTRRLRDDESVPTGVLTWIARDPGAEEATLRAVVEIVAERLGKTEEPDPTLLTTMVSLQGRLGLDEAAFETLTLLDSVRPSEVTRWNRYRLASKLERWGTAADILGPLVEDGTFVHLRGSYIRLLGKAGRTDEVSRQIDILLAQHARATSAPAAIDAGTDSMPDAFRDASLGPLIPVFWDLRDAGKDEEAGRLLHRILEAAPDHKLAERLRTHLYGSADELQALAAIQDERWSEEEDPRALFDEGTRRLTSGDAEGAIDLLRRAAPELPDLEAVWYNLGMAAYRLEEWATVASAFGRAAGLNPQRADSLFFSGIALAKLERCADAVSALESAVSLDPERTLAHYHLWSCYSALGDRTAAGRHRRLYEAARQ